MDDMGKNAAPKELRERGSVNSHTMKEDGMNQDPAA
jgi:hypothetical protein